MLNITFEGSNSMFGDVMASREWSDWLDAALSGLARLNLLRSLRPVQILQPGGHTDPGMQHCVKVTHNQSCKTDLLGTVRIPAADEARPKETVIGSGPDEVKSNREVSRACNRSAVEVSVSKETIQAWLDGKATSGTEVEEAASGELTKLRLFSGNDYLGLSAHPAVRAAAAEAAREYGMGPRASPLVCGYTWHHQRLERALADLEGTEDCLLFPTGFAANMGVITAVCSPTPGDQGQPNPISMVAVFSDELNHASIIDGLRLSQRMGRQSVTSHVYRHCDMTHLDELLSASSAPRKVVVTDTLFSMDGDFAPMRQLAELRRKHGFLLVVDEAHATLVCGHRGGGAAEAFGVSGEVDLHVGTLSKAVGCHGGFVATSRKWKQWILSRGRAFIYSTGQPIPTMAAALAALEVAKNEPWRQRHVWALVDALSAALGVRFSSPIISVVIGGAKEALDASNDLLRRGFHVPAIRPPTVAEGSSRLRIALSAAHTFDDVAALVAALSPLLRTARPELAPRGSELGVKGPSGVIVAKDSNVRRPPESSFAEDPTAKRREFTLQRGALGMNGLIICKEETSVDRCETAPWGSEVGVNRPDWIPVGSGVSVGDAGESGGIVNGSESDRVGDDLGGRPSGGGPAETSRMNYEDGAEFARIARTSTSECVDVSAIRLKRSSECRNDAGPERRCDTAASSEDRLHTAGSGSERESKLELTQQLELTEASSRPYSGQRQAWAVKNPQKSLLTTSDRNDSNSGFAKLSRL